MTLLRRRRRVIDEEGRELDERPSGLRAALAVVFHRPDADAYEDERPTAELPVYQTANTGPDDLAGIPRMPFTILRLADWVRAGFHQVEQEIDEFGRFMARECNRMFRENNRRMSELDKRLERLAARQRAWIAMENGRVAAGAMAAMYAAGGTELVQALTPAVLARMDAQREQRLALGGAL
jgi:uncharacterized protein YecT (DUF1311 family)